MPAWCYPFQASAMADNWGIGAPSTPIEDALAQQVADFSGYAMLDKHYYFELGTYHAEGTAIAPRLASPSATP